MKAATIYSCDVCKKESKYNGVSINVIFATEPELESEQPPFFELKKLDLCEKCNNKILSEQYVLSGRYRFVEQTEVFTDYSFKKLR